MTDAKTGVLIEWSNLQINNKNQDNHNLNAMKQLPSYILGAIGEHQVLSRLLYLGHSAAIVNLSVENAEGIDILCRNKDGKNCAVQVKTTAKNNWLTGISHKEFYDDNGNIDLAKGRLFLEKKIVGPWVFVHVGGNAVVPTFRFYVLSRSEVIEMIYSSEEWCLTGYNRTKPLQGNGPVCIFQAWLCGFGVPANSRHIEWVNPFASQGSKFEEAWHKLWTD